MGFFDKNLDDREGLMRIAAGFAGMILGLIIFGVDHIGIIFAAIGLSAFGEGYHRWSLFRALRRGG